MEKETTGKCKVCDGMLVEVVSEVISRRDPAIVGPVVIKPGLEKKHIISEEFYCSKCGIKYKFI